jgi:hypothetical protein
MYYVSGKYWEHASWGIAIIGIAAVVVLGVGGGYLVDRIIGWRRRRR